MARCALLLSKTRKRERGAKRAKLVPFWGDGAASRAEGRMSPNIQVLRSVLTTPVLSFPNKWVEGRFCNFRRGSKAKSQVGCRFLGVPGAGSQLPAQGRARRVGYFVLGG